MGSNAESTVVPLLSATALFAVGAWMLRRFPPELYAIYPVCPVWRFFHMLCPGCGSTRAMANLLRGDLRGALRLNALTTVLLPLLGLVCVERSLFPARHRILSDGHMAAILLVVALIFGVVRNVI